MKIKNIIIPIVVILIFSIVYFLVIPRIQYKNLAKKVLESFETSLINLGISAEKDILEAKEYGAFLAYSYIVDDKKVKVYIYNKNSNKFKQGQQDGFIESSKDKNFKLYGIFRNNCVLYMEEGFSNDDEVLNVFLELSENLN